MATLQKFKFLATRCAAIGSPARSPTTSPVVHIRRRKTLRMLLGRGTGSNAGNFQRRFLHHYQTRRDEDDAVDDSSSNRRNLSDGKPPQSRNQNSNNSSNSSNRSNNSSIGVRSKLKDLFVSSPTAEEDDAAERLLKDSGRSCGESVLAARRGGQSGGVRPLSATLRQRLLMRRAWRPVLVAIPEVSP